MRKKIISLLCAAILAVGLLPQISFAAEAEDISATEDMLIKLGVLNGEKATLDTVINSIAGFVYDDPALYGTAEEIARASGMIDAGSEYRGSGAVLTEDVYKYAVIAAGYQMLAEQNGGYPDGYIGMAQKTGISKGVSAKVGKNIKREDLVQILENMLEVNPVVYELTYENRYKIDKDETLLSKNRKIYKVEGLMNANSKTSIYRTYGAGEGKFELSNVKYINKHSEYNELLGKNVVAYVHETDMGYECMAAYEGRNDVFVLDANDITAADFSAITYKTDNNRTKQVKLAGSPKLIHNGVFWGPHNDNSILKPDIGGLELIDNDRDGKYDIVKITSYQTMVVSSIDATSKSLYNRYTFTGHLASVSLNELSENEDYRIYKGGKEVDFSAISVNDVLSVAVSRETQNRSIVVYISDSEPLQGYYTGADTENNSIAVDGEYYVVSKDFESERQSGMALKFNTEYTFYYDAFDNLAFYLSVANTDYYVFLAYKWDTVNDVYTVRYIDMEGAEKTAPLADKVRVDEVSWEKSLLFSDYQTNMTSPEVVKMKFNSKGQLKSIDFPGSLNASATNYDEFRKLANCNGRYWPNTKWLYGSPNLYLEDDAKIVIFPETESRSAEDYRIEDASSFLQYNKQYKLDAYDCDEFSYTHLLRVKNDDDLKNEHVSSTLFVIAGRSEAVNEDNERVIRFKGNMGDFNNLTVMTKDLTAFSAIDRGYIIKMFIDEEGYASKPEVVENLNDLTSDLTQSSMTDSGDTWSDDPELKGVIDKIDLAKERMILKMQKNGAEEYMTFKLPKNMLITKYDKSERLFETVSAANLHEGSVMYIRANHGEINTIITVEE